MPKNVLKKIFVLLTAFGLIATFSASFALGAGPVKSEGKKGLEHLRCVRGFFNEEKINLPSDNYILVKFKSGINEEKIDSLNKKLGGEPVKKIKKLGWQKIKVPKDARKMDLIDAYENDPVVESVCERVIYKPCLTPNDPSFPNQWHHALINSELAWGISQQEFLPVLWRYWIPESIVILIYWPISTRT